MCISFPALGCRRWQHAGVCQKKRTHEKLNVTRLFSFLPGCLRCLLLCTPASSYLEVAGSSGYNILFFFSTLLLICFSVSASLLFVSVFFSFSHMYNQKHQTARTGGGSKHVFRTSSQDSRCVEGGIQAARVCLSVCTWGYASKPYMQTHVYSVGRNQQWTLIQLASAHPSLPSPLSPVISDSYRSYKSQISISQSVKTGQNWGAAQR